MPEARDPRWLLLIHQIPPKPDYLRVKIWRRLQRVGAVAIKNSVYVMPRNDQSLEDFQWTVREITEGGGGAWICEAGFVEGISNDQVEALFRAARDADYAAISEEAKELARKFPVGKGLNDGLVTARTKKIHSVLAGKTVLGFRRRYQGRSRRTLDQGWHRK
jgi:hypothetical protein